MFLASSSYSIELGSSTISYSSSTYPGLNLFGFFIIFALLVVVVKRAADATPPYWVSSDDYEEGGSRKS